MAIKDNLVRLRKSSTRFSFAPDPLRPDHLKFETVEGRHDKDSLLILGFPNVRELHHGQTIYAMPESSFINLATSHFIPK